MRDEKYDAYLNSREWNVLKEAVKRRSGGTCERCRKNPGQAVHHLTYARKYQERLEDLQHICNPCHEYIHAKRHVDPAALHVYMAGPVVHTNEWINELGETEFEPRLETWRDVAFPQESEHAGTHQEGETARHDGKQYIYAGPTIDGSGHGCPTYDNHSTDDQEELVERCLKQIRQCDAVFAWLDRPSVGTFVELGYARACQKPIYLVCSSQKIADACYFAVRLASNQTFVNTVEGAWQRFTTKFHGMVRRGWM